jgi:diguanylate cyclase (GGDEF)-like protein
LAKAFLFLLIVCLAAAPEAAAQFRYDTWTTDNGLPQNGVRQITQTPDGYLWFTTFDGLVRFDGVRFTTFSTGNTKGIINNRFAGLYGDKNGTLYATTVEDGVLTVYRDGEFTSYNSQQVPGHYIQRMEPDEHGEVRFQTEDEERTTKSWYHLRNGTFVLIKKEVAALRPQTVVGRSGAVWTVTTKEAVEQLNGKTTVYKLDIKPITYNLNTFVDSAGYLWIGEQAAHRVGGGTVQRFGEAEGLVSSIHHSFWEEPDGGVWFASGGGSTEGVGLVRYHDGKVQSFGLESGLLSRAIHSVFHDREGTTWLATSKGLSRLRKKVLNSLSVKDGLHQAEVYPIYRDRKERIWIGTIQGLSLYENGRFTQVALKPDPSAPPDEAWRNESSSVQSLWEDPDGRIWAGVYGGIFLIENGTARLLAGSKSHHVFAIRSDRHGNVWATSNRGVLQFRDRRLVGTLTVKDGLPNEFMTTIFEDSKGTLWFGGFGGLSQFRNGTLTNYTTKDGLTGSYVRSIYEDADGTLWIGTYDEGLSRFKDGRFVNYKREHGLYNNGVFAIREDAGGHFWISSNRGIYRVKRQELNDFADGKIARIHSVGYGTQDGMLSTECNGGRQPASITDRDGRFWFPTQDGVVVIEPRNESYNTRPPSVVIESATVEREVVDLRHGLTIAPGRRNLEITFAGVSLIKSEQMKFRYKLEGHDADWIDADTRRTAYYSYLPPGTYRFVVKAANSDNIWNEEGASLALELKPFFYETRWFYSLSALGGVFLLLVAWKTSVQQLQTRERRLAELVAEKTEALRKANEQLKHMAHSDVLTEIGNRRQFDEFLADEWRRAIRFKTEISLILIDIDHFKLFNDTYGHQAGDECLKQVAAGLRATIHRPTDLLARFGGEEFAVVLGGTGHQGALKIARHGMAMVNGLGIPHRESPTSDHVTVSVGVATIAVALGTSEADLIKAADEALYRAKAGGRNQIAS